LSQRVTYQNGTTVPSSWLNIALIREQGPFAYVVHGETSGSTTTYYADPMSPAGTPSNNIVSADPVIQVAINNA
jgi:hypothetical protein